MSENTIPDATTIICNESSVSSNVSVAVEQCDVIDISSFNIPEEISNTNSEFENMGNAINFEVNSTNVIDENENESRGIHQAFSSHQSPSFDLHRIVLEERKKRLRTQHEAQTLEQCRDNEHAGGVVGSVDDEFDPSIGCTICMCNFEQNDMVTAFNCNHRFHTKEAREWLSLKRVCPSCFKPADDMRHYIFKSQSISKTQIQSPPHREPTTHVTPTPLITPTPTPTLITPTPTLITPTPTLITPTPTSEHIIFGNHCLDRLITFTGRVHSIRVQKTMIFLVIRIIEKGETIQCVAFKKQFQAPNQDMKVISANIEGNTEWERLSAVRCETVIKVVGTLSRTPNPIKSSEITFKDREVNMSGFVIISNSEPLSIQISDLNWNSEVGQQACLNNRFLDLRSQQKQAIFKLQSLMTQYMREFLYKNEFVEIHTPKLTSASSEGGADVFTTNYFGKQAYLAQSPQLYKQIMINSDFPKVFEIGPVFRAEKSNSKRHLTEFTGFDIEMVIEKDYTEVHNMLFMLLYTTFGKLYAKHEDLIRMATNNNDKIAMKKIVVPYQEAIVLLNENLSVGEPLLSFGDDLNSAQEKKLGQLIKERSGSDFFILDKFPMKLRPFYTMPIPSDSQEEIQYSKSYDIILRGQEILSGAQRNHVYNDLMDMVKTKGLTDESISSISFYLDSFKNGSFPHGGGGFGLERLLANFLGLDEIRMTSLFPRDPKRLDTNLAHLKDFK